MSLRFPVLPAAALAMLGGLALSACQAPAAGEALAEAGAALVGEWEEAGPFAAGGARWTLSAEGLARHTVHDEAGVLRTDERCRWALTGDSLELDCPSDVLRARVRLDGQVLAFGLLERDESGAPDEFAEHPGLTPGLELGPVIAEWSGTIERRRLAPQFEEVVPEAREPVVSKAREQVVPEARMYVAQEARVRMYAGFVLRTSLRQSAGAGSSIAIVSEGRCALDESGGLACYMAGYVPALLPLDELKDQAADVLRVPFDEESGEARFADLSLTDLRWTRVR